MFKNEQTSKSNNALPFSSITKKISSFGNIHQEQATLHYSNIKQEAFYQKDLFIIIAWLLFYPLGIFLIYKYSLKLRKFRHLFNILPLIIIALANNTIALILGLFLPFIFIPIFTLGLFYCLLKTKYFMPYCTGIIISCLGFLTFSFLHI